MRTVAKRCFDEMMMDMPLSPSVQVDFGINTPEHHRAIQKIVRSGATVQELSDALGNGKNIMELIKKYAPQYANLSFKTAYDIMDETFPEGAIEDDEN